jgi:hypothetical protein
LIRSDGLGIVADRFGEGLAVSGLRLAVALLLLASTATAQELPKNLALQCSGNSKSMKFYPVVHKSPQWEDGFFNVTVQLKDKVMFDLTNNAVLGRDCALEKGEIACTFDETKYIERINGTERNQGAVLIAKDNGAARWIHTHAVFHGKTATGTPGAAERVERTGICRTVQAPKPLF